MAFGALYFIAMFVALGLGLYFIIEEAELDLIPTISKFFIFYLGINLVLRHFFQKMPVLSIKPLLHENIKKSVITHYVLIKTALSFINIKHLFFLIPFVIIVWINADLNHLKLILFCVSLMLWIYIINYLNILIENRTKLLIGIVAALATIAGLYYFNIFDLTVYTQYLFSSVYHYPVFFLLPVTLTIILYSSAYKIYRSHLHLDAGLQSKKEDVKATNLSFLDRFGQLSLFLKNDVRLILRNKRPKSTLFVSLAFIFYGFILDPKGEFSQIFIGIFVTGGFMFTFGQFVPSWDSQYYPLLMTQNIRYRDYLQSKWWLVVISIGIASIFASIYLYYGWVAYFALLASAIYNIGINSYIVLLAGAYTRTPIDLESGKNVFGDKKAFNTKTFLLAFPKIALPFAIYALGRFHSHEAGIISVMVFGLIGLAFKNLAFSWVEKIYKEEKHITIQAYKQK